MSHPDTAITLDAADIGAGMHARDTIKWWPRVLVEKYDDEQAAWEIVRPISEALDRIDAEGDSTVEGQFIAPSLHVQTGEE